MQKRAKIILVLAISISLLATCLIGYALTNFTFSVNIPVGPNPDFKVYCNGTYHASSFTLDFGPSVNPGDWCNATLDIKNTGNIALSFTVTTDIGLPDWTIGYSGNMTIASPTNWVNGTLYFYVPVTTPPALYTGSVSVIPSTV